jgi:hypothetical protein
MAKHRGGASTPNYILWGIVILIGGFVLLMCYVYGTQGVLDWFSDWLDKENTP